MAYIRNNGQNIEKIKYYTGISLIFYELFIFWKLFLPRKNGPEDIPPTRILLPSVSLS